MYAPDHWRRTGCQRYVQDRDPVRILLLTLVVDGAIPRPTVGAPTDTSAGASETVGIDGPVAHVERAQTAGDGDYASLLDPCACCTAEPELALPPTYLPAVPSSARGFAPRGAPVTQEHLRLLFRPPMAA